MALEQMQTDVKDRGGRPERGAVVMDGLLVAAAVLQEVGVVVVNFGIVRQSLDTRAETSKDNDSFSCSGEKRHRDKMSSWLSSPYWGISKGSSSFISFPLIKHQV